MFRSAVARGLSLWEALESAGEDLEMASLARTKLQPFHKLVRSLRATRCDGKHSKSARAFLA